jgi:hypothetical protein
MAGLGHVAMQQLVNYAYAIERQLGARCMQAVMQLGVAVESHCALALGRVWIGLQSAKQNHSNHSMAG